MSTEPQPVFPDSKVRSYFMITNRDLVESFRDPIRRAILVALRYGTESIKEHTTTEETIKADGTKVRTTVVEEKKTKRFWLTVPDIVANVEQYLPEVDVSKYNCYYHLPKLVEQGLVEEFSQKDEDDSKSRRGIYYRRTAKVFIIIDSKMSGDVVGSYFKLFKDGLNVDMKEKDWGHLEDLMLRQIEMVDETMEYLATQMKDVDIESTALSDLLQGLAYIFLSDNDEFLGIQKEIKDVILTPCCGNTTDMDAVCSYCGDSIEKGEMILRNVEGKSQSFCSETCADNFVKSLK
ncbi:MAG: hypothetical protein EAX87_00605 [Candidatus Thorarchaeota archaeon]|nr:hypothetical protein [Candidatus Thorarchaeota archaeon]